MVLIYLYYIMNTALLKARLPTVYCAVRIVSSLAVRGC